MIDQCKAELIFRCFNFDCELERGHDGKHKSIIKVKDWREDTSDDFEVRWK